MESTLSIQYRDLLGEVGSYLGYGRGADFGETTWTTHQQNQIESCVKSGLRQFYHPPPSEAGSHDWSFLRPTASLAFVTTASTVALPDDFGGFEGEITIPSTTSQLSWPIPVVGEGLVRQRYADLPSVSGRPEIAAVVPLKGTTAKHGQRFQLYLWPAADQNYTLQFTYYVLPEYLTGSLPYAYGGAAHAETILESCLAVAEERVEDEQSVHAAKFKERLAASITHDRRNRPQKIGYNGDRSDGVPFRRRDIYGWSNPVTLNGVSY